MNNLKKRRESVATVYRKTTKFLTSNTANLLKKMPNTRKYRLLASLVEEGVGNDNRDSNKDVENNDERDEEDLGDRELDYYLGVRKKETYWRDLAGREQIRKDFLLYHCGVSEEDYEKFYKKTIKRRVSFKQPKLKQVPFKITRKKHRRNGSFDGESWREKTGIFKIFTNRRDSDTTSDSYSECDSDDETNKDEEILDKHQPRNSKDDSVWSMSQHFNEFNTVEKYVEGVRIKEVSEGRPCDNCPELCPGFISHPWR
ncbi:unnamed protein product [Parnassius apollo]|uniref:(apollo) hypothetical protein n=1 Tax=Parnassius apollo TaxID=110799 RepID=A0A8S3WML2_PARAO|nr:unnamed protein product [Parnassius apollo]